MLKWKHFLSRWLALALGILAGTAVGAVSHAQTLDVEAELNRWDQLANEAPDTQDEATPEEIARAMKKDRKFRLKENKRSTQQGTTRVQVDVFMRPVGLGITKEFMIVWKDGAVKDAFVVSTGKTGNPTIRGSFPLTVEYRAGKGAGNSALKPYPYHVSAKYQNSPMYWGLNVKNGYWVHSTPHYGQLGRPASMGCVRTTFPAAMEVWDLITNDVDGSGRMTIRGSATEAERVAQKVALDKALTQVSKEWLIERIEKDLGDAHAITRGDYDGYGHARRGELNAAFPKCDDKDCFAYFGRKKPVGML